MSHGFRSPCLTGKECDKLCFTGKSDGESFCFPTGRVHNYVCDLVVEEDW